MKTTRLLIAVLGLAFAILLIAPAAFAQDVAAPTPDLSNVKLPGDIPAVTILALLGTLVVSAIKFVAPRIPAKYLPFIAPVATVVLDWLSNLTFGTTSNVWIALGAGVASIGLFELKKQATKPAEPVA